MTNFSQTDFETVVVVPFYSITRSCVERETRRQKSDFFTILFECSAIVGPKIFRPTSGRQQGRPTIYTMYCTTSVCRCETVLRNNFSGLFYNVCGSTSLFTMYPGPPPNRTHRNSALWRLAPVLILLWYERRACRNTFCQIPLRPSFRAWRVCVHTRILHGLGAAKKKPLWFFFYFIIIFFSFSPPLVLFDMHTHTPTKGPGNMYTHAHMHARMHEKKEDCC